MSQLHPVFAQALAPFAPPPIDYAAEIQKIRDKLASIDAACKSWKSCQDGSYEMALDSYGYFKLLNQLVQLKKEAGIE